jgi:hypothetical protein
LPETTNGNHLPLLKAQIVMLFIDFVYFLYLFWSPASYSMAKDFLDWHLELNYPVHLWTSFAVSAVPVKVIALLIALIIAIFSIYQLRTHLKHKENSKLIAVLSVINLISLSCLLFLSLTIVSHISQLGFPIGAPLFWP